LTLRTAFSPRDAKTRNLNLIACGRIDKYAERSVKVWVGFCQMRRFNRGALLPHDSDYSAATVFIRGEEFTSDFALVNMVSQVWPSASRTRIIPAAKLFQPVLDDVYELSTPAPTPMDVAHRRRLTPEAVTHLDWHNEMSKLVLDISDQVEAAADDRARGVIIRRLKRALKGSG
jgi:hypothetical protein